MIEYTCQDCGHRIIAHTFTSPGERALCATCDWIRTHVPTAEQPAARQRLGVPLDPDQCT